MTARKNIRSGLYSDASWYETEEHRIKGHDRWFRTEEQRDAYVFHRNLARRAARAGYDPGNPIDLESFRLLEEAVNDTMIGNPREDLNKIVRLRALIKRNPPTSEFVQQVIAIVEGDPND